MLLWPSGGASDFPSLKLPARWFKIQATLPQSGNLIHSIYISLSSTCSYSQLEHNFGKKNLDKLQVTAGTQRLIPRSSKRVTFAPNQKNYEQAKISHAWKIQVPFRFIIFGMCSRVLAGVHRCKRSIKIVLVFALGAASRTRCPVSTVQTASSVHTNCKIQTMMAWSWYKQIKITKLKTSVEKTRTLYIFEKMVSFWHLAKIYP